MLVFIFKVFAKPFKTIGGVILHKFIFKFYKTYLFFHKYFDKTLQPLKNWIFAPLGSNKIIFFIIILISGLIVGNNISAKETRIDEAGLSEQQNIIFKISSSEELGYIEETLIEQPMNQTFKYQDESEYKPYLTREERIVAILKEDIEPISLATEYSLIKPSLASTTSNIKLRDKIIDYSVEQGDTISGIAQNFDVSIKTILWANNLTVQSYIKPGDVLKILPTNGVAHTIKKGDQLLALAKKYDSDVDKIIEYNKLINADDITIGDTIIIPGGTMPQPVIVPKKYAYTPPAESGYVSTPAPAGVLPSGTKLQWPTSGYHITQYYSWRHTGVDIGGDYSSPLYAAESGTVIKAQAGWNGGYGMHVIIDHGSGFDTLYAHASKLFVKVGDHVNRGQTIAMMGSTGRSTGPHIHFEVRVNGTKVNPLSYIK